MFKPVLVFATVCASASAFAPAAVPGLMGRAAARPTAVRGLRMQSLEDKEIMASKEKLDAGLGDGFQPKGQSQGPTPVSTGGTQYSSLPKEEIAPLFLIPQSSVVGDGSMAGDKGFDPLGFADSVEKLRIYREAELKHGRLAMLAALGWPVAEFLNGPISKAMGAKSLLVAAPTKVVAGAALGAAQQSLVPSVLNGGLENISPIYWASVFALSAGIEFYATKIQKRAGFRATMAALGAEDLTGIDIDGDGQVGAPKMLGADNYMPGDLGFDPLGLYAGKSAEWKRDMQLKEVNNGRLAMIAITGYAFNEAATKISVIKSIGL